MTTTTTVERAPIAVAHDDTALARATMRRVSLGYALFEVPPVIMTVGFVAMALLPWPVAKVLALALVPIGAMMFLAPYWCLPPMMFRGAAMAVAIGLVNSIGNIGGFLGPNIIGVAKTLTGSTTGAFLVLAAISVLSATSALALRRHAAFRMPSIVTPSI